MVLSLWGSLGNAIQILLGLMALDIATGVISSIVNQDGLCSKKATYGIGRKAGSLVIILGVELVTTLAANFPLPINPGNVVAWFYVLVELISLLENAGKLGAPVPSWLLRAITDAKNRLDSQQEAAVTALESQQGAVATAKEAVIAAKDAQKATEALVDTLPAKKDGQP